MVSLPAFGKSLLFVVMPAKAPIVNLLKLSWADAREMEEQKHNIKSSRFT